MTYERPPTSNQCAICGQPATCSTLKDPWGKSDEMEGRCAKHSPKLRDPDDVALIDRQRAEIEQLRTLLRIAQDEWYDDNGQWGDGFGLKHWTRKADALLSDESSFRETEQHRE